MIHIQGAKSKYGNQKIMIDGHTFDSKAEAKRYQELKLMKVSGTILWFNLQPSFLLSGNIRYRPDFIVCGSDLTIWVEDVKGMETEGFKIKKKLWEEAYPGFELKLIRA